MNLATRVIKADPWRKTRFHDLKGARIDARSWLDIPRVLAQCAARELLGYRPALPWISYSAIRHLSRLIQPCWHVLEFGSGMSTLYFARRCAWVHSIESNGEWYQKVQALLESHHLTNVHLEQRSGAQAAIMAYRDLSAYPDASLECVFIDGHARDRCVEAAWRVIKPGGVIYLDNTDLGCQWEDYARAEQLLLEGAHARGMRVTFHTGLAPAQFVATQGLLAE